ncbi:MAG: hypothetical protein ACXWV0_01580, partial [Flavisolibacter sp.]
LVNLLRGADLEVYPLLVSDRSHGKVDSSFSFLGQFNKVVALVLLDGQKYVLDGTDYYTPVNMMPMELLNTVGFLVDQKKEGFVVLRDPNKKGIYTVEIKGQVQEEQVKNRVSIHQQDYARVGSAARYTMDKKGYREKLLKTAHQVEVDSFEIQNLENDSAALIHSFSMKQPLTKSGEYFLLYYNFFTGFENSPFLGEHRFTNIDFGTRTDCILKATYNLPETMMVESLPKNSRMIIPGGQLVAVREIKVNGRQIDVSVRIEVNSAEFSADDYYTVKEFYKKLEDLLNEPVVLKNK